MARLRSKVAAGVAFACAFLAGFGLIARADSPERTLPVVTQKNAISGTMDITFETRTRKDHTKAYGPNAPALGAQDTYTCNLTVAETTEFTGSIKRSPRLARETTDEKGNHQENLVQKAALVFDVGLAIRNPKDLTQRKVIGKWTGTVPIDRRGVYHLEEGNSGSRAPLRIAVDSVGSAAGFEDDFGGLMIGKAGDASKYKQVRYTRRLNGKVVTVLAKKIDPLTFTNLRLAAGPAAVYPATTVNGHFDYDYDSSNWYLDNLTFKYTVDGHAYEDRVSGTIRWVEDPNRKTNGKGYYDFNIRFNEPTGPETEDAAFSEAKSGGGGAEDAFFTVDDSIPSMTGTVEYVDKMIPGKDAPSASRVTYHLNANKLTKQQIVNFFKLWTLAVGPINDE